MLTQTWIGSAIRDLAAARHSPIVAAAQVESYIELWDVNLLQKLSSFSSKYEFGANNLAVSPGGDQVVSGITRSRARILSAHRSSNGSLIWQRSNLNYPSGLQYSRSGEYLFCNMHDQDIEVLEASTGKTLKTIKGINRFVDGSNCCLVSTKDCYRVLENRFEHVRFEIPRLTFALLDAELAANCAFLSESGGPVRAVDCENGKEVWRVFPPSGSHVLKLFFEEDANALYGVLWDYQQGLFRRLVRFDGENGNLHIVCDLDSFAEAFVATTKQLVSASGYLYELRSGQVAGKIDLPMKEYPVDPIKYVLPD